MELYGATMAKDGQNDLQTFVCYIKTKRDKLKFLKVDVPQSDLISIFLHGLHPVFQPLKLHYAVKSNRDGRNFDEIIETIRNYSEQPAVIVELTKLRTSNPPSSIFTAVSHQN